jgi:hypothetical protein
MVIDMATFSIPMFIRVNVDDEKINSISSDIVSDNSAFDQAIAGLIRDELIDNCNNVENMVDFSIFIEDIPYTDYYYED